MADPERFDPDPMFYIDLFFLKYHKTCSVVLVLTTLIIYWSMSELLAPFWSTASLQPCWPLSVQNVGGVLSSPTSDGLAPSSSHRLAHPFRRMNLAFINILKDHTVIVISPFLFSERLFWRKKNTLHLSEKYFLV